MAKYAVGSVIDERYRVTGLLGQGAHGVVYAAEDEMLGSRVALKCLSAELAADPAFKVRMHREARAMGALSGTSATQIFAFNKTPEGGLYIVMELLAGRDLEAYLRELESHGARIELKRLVNLLGPIADTLETAHGLALVHRDVKPGNVFVLDTLVRGGVRLLDFGLAKDLNATSLTADGMIAGSPGYIAPEVWRGRAKEADRRIDVYSLGAVIFRALAGAPPFNPKDPMDRFLIAVTRGPRPSLVKLRRDLPVAIDGWVEKALAIEPADRFSSVAKMWEALRAIAELPVRQVRTDPPSIPWEVEIDVDIEVEVATLRGTQIPRP
ncbi:MAG: serine/threonine protein kinase [Polyangiaceae bacterium]|nr:serine/threonine protein kinase [Polyangiaceae bacterium]